MTCGFKKHLDVSLLTPQDPTKCKQFWGLRDELDKAGQSQLAYGHLKTFFRILGSAYAKTGEIDTMPPRDLPRIWMHCEAKSLEILRVH